MTGTAVGIDIGGTGMKGAVVDLATGELLTDRIKVPTPKGGTPEAIIEEAVKLVEQLHVHDPDAPVGICFPAVVKHGVTLSAANISKKWIGLQAEDLFERALGRNITFANDADAAGYAEASFGAARGVDGVAIMTTL